MNLNILKANTKNCKVLKDAVNTSKLGNVIKDVGTINKNVSENAQKVINAKVSKLIDEVGQAPYGVVPASQEINGAIHEGYRYQFLNPNRKIDNKKLGDEYFISAFKTQKL